MKKLIIAYLTWLVLTMFIPAMTGTLWPAYIPLVLISVLYLAMARNKISCVVGVVLIIFSVFLIVSDIRAGNQREMQKKEQIEEFNQKNKMEAEPSN